MGWLSKAKDFLAGAATETVANAADTIISNFKADPTKKREMELLLQQALWDFVERNGAAFQEFILEYEGRAKDVPRWVVGLRAIVRPILTFACFGAFTFLVYSWLYNTAVMASDGFQPIFELVYRLTFIVFVFWFGDRLLQNNLESLVTVFKRPKQPKE